VLFYRPRQFPAGWERTDLWRSAAAIPGVTVLVDPDGLEAERFGAKTSGHVLVYDSAGRLLFSGGITGSRGHEGDNDGSDSVLRLLTHGPPPRRHTLVFGCPIRGSQAGSGT
jgi:glyoxylase-like metal-dependent hydrolase (beta-lactamase superfamily II)